MTIVDRRRGIQIADAFQGDVFASRQFWDALLAADAARILAAASINAAAHSVTTFLAQPDYARNLTVVASGAATGNVVVTGTNIRGATITETLALNGTTPVVGNKAFKTVTSVALPQVSGRTIDLGIGVKLGLKHKLTEASVIDAFTDGVREATAATVANSSSAVESNTVSTNTAPNGTRDFTVIYMSQDRGVTA